MNYILKLAGWYPSRIDHLTGDFVQRHAESISIFRKVIVLFLVKDPSLRHNTIESSTRTSPDGNLVEYIVYYSAGGPFERGLSLLRYLSIGERMVRQIRHEHGDPERVHVSVPWKAGLLALRLKKRYGWPYILTEHWAGYTPLNPTGLHTKNAFVRRIYKNVYRGADLFLPVSQDLGRQVDRWFPDVPAEVVYNTTDTDLFFCAPVASAPVAGAPAVKRMVHVSTMNFQKNITGILRVLAILMSKRQDVEVTLVGPYPPEIRQTLLDTGLLDKKIFLTGVLSYAEVASLLKNSHVLFLFSRFENQPCVLLEALCCGLPVVSTSVGGIPEIVDKTNGLLVGSEREDQLLEAFEDILNRYSSYDREKIAAAAGAKFSYAVVGRQFSEIYRLLTEGRIGKNVKGGR
jgi:glycosyltransferase involved in cell wall biosynthesis